MNATQRTNLTIILANTVVAGSLLPWIAGCGGITVGFPDDSGRPGTVSRVTATETGLREIGLRWPKPDDNVHKYRIERSAAKDGSFSAIAVVGSEPSEYTDRGAPESPLADSSTYYYRLIPESKDGLVGVASDPVRGVTAPPPDPPKLARIQAHKSRGVRLAWEASSSLAVTTYAVRRTRASAPGEFKTIATLPGLEYEDGGTAASDLRDSTEYLYSVAAVNRVGSESKPARFEPIMTLPPPKPVLGLGGVSREVRCVPLSWKASPEPDVVCYDIYRGESKDGPFKKIARVDGRESTRYLDGGNNPGKLEDCGTYCYRIRAVNIVTSESADSETAVATTREEPPVVENVCATPACPRRVPLCWQMSPDERVIGYEIWRAGENDDFAQINIAAGRDATNYTDYGASQDPAGLGALKDNAPYKYKIVTFNYGQVRSSASKTVAVRTKKRPDTPAGPIATTDLPHAIRVTWKANPEPDIAEYEIQASDQPDSGFRKLAAVPPLPGVAAMAARESALDNSAARHYRIKAVDQDRLESDWSAVASGKARPLPPAPTRLTTAPVLSGVKITWEAPPAPPIREYGVWKQTMFAWTLVGRTDKPEFVFLDRDLAKSITVAISAIDHENLEGAKSSSIEVASRKD